jgi:glycosyltransferase involved in cell wall biosynthesis
MSNTRKPKNILCLIDALTTGGAQTALFNVVDNLDRSEYRPYVLALFKDGRVGDSLRENGIFVECLDIVQPFTLRTFVKLYPYLVKFSRENEIDFIHSFLTASAIYGGIVARRLGIPSALNVHTVLSQSHIVGKRTTRYLELLARSLNRILIAGNKMTEKELKRLRVWRDRDHIKMIYNGITPAGESRAETFGREVIKITMVANFFIEKDHLTLIKAYELLKNNYPLCLSIIAEGEGACRDRVMDYVEEKELQEISFQKNRNEDTYTHQTDIFVLATFSEGDPIVLKEAMSVGIPCIASRVGAVDEVIEDGVDGMLIDAGSVDGLVKALTRLIKDAEYREVLSQKAIEKYRRKFTLDTMTHEYEMLYGQVAGGDDLLH